jgi:hypothetical protein
MSPGSNVEISKARPVRAFFIFAPELLCNAGRFGYFFTKRLCRPK